MKVSLQGYHSRYITLQIEGKVQPGDPVQFCANATVKKAENGAFAGVVRSVREDLALVQTGGYVQLCYTGTKPAFGFVKLAAAAQGVTVSDTGREVLVAEVDETQSRVGVLF